MNIGQSQSPGRFLVVDDEPLVRASLRMLLEIDGHIVETAADGLQAVEAFQKDKFDLIFTDFAMPGMNGHEFATMIKARDPNQPVIMISAYADVFSTKETPPNIDLLLGKPFTLQELRKAVRSLMGRELPSPLTSCVS